MKLAMTLMVRDEADIVGAMLQHHAAQGIDVFIITDNGSVDGTRQIIEEFARTATVDLRSDPEHRKQQHSSVTRMARDAATVHGADWIINADADEFWFPVDPTRTLKDVMSEVPTSLGSFTVPVHDMTGPPALFGSGLDRLVYRDMRPVSMINGLGLFAHATPNAVHAANPQVEVAQGNHFVSTPSMGEPDPALRIEVLHLPWRSWDQFHRKVQNAGRAYESNKTLLPSPNHHGMRDYRRLQDGMLMSSYIVRHPSGDELEEGLESGWFIPDERLALEGWRGNPEVLVPKDVLSTQRAIGASVVNLEVRLARTESARTELEGQLHIANLRIADLEKTTAQLQEMLQHHLERRVVRLADWVGRHIPWAVRR